MPHSRKSSKRRTLQEKYKIKKRVTQHHAKLRRLAKKTGMANRKKKREELHIPNNWPFKEELLLEYEQKREAAAEAAEREKLERKLKKQKRLGQFHEEEEERGENEEGGVEEEEEPGFQTRDYLNPSSLLEHSDIIIQVLDARGTWREEREKKSN